MTLPFEEMWAVTGVEDSCYHDALCKSEHKIILQRSVSELWVNYYNVEILKTRRGNMELQDIVDA